MTLMGMNINHIRTLLNRRSSWRHIISEATTYPLSIEWSLWTRLLVRFWGYSACLKDVRLNQRKRANHTLWPRSIVTIKVTFVPAQWGKGAGNRSINHGPKEVGPKLWAFVFLTPSNWGRIKLEISAATWDFRSVPLFLINKIGINLFTS